MRIQMIEAFRNMVVFAMVASLAACGGGTTVAGGGGGVVGTGKQVTVTGEVTGFGSVIVNGIEFTRSTDPAVSTTPVVLAFDNFSRAGEGALRPGMMVSLTGTYDAATNRGSYSQIVFSPELRGSLDNGSVNPAAGSLTVLGRRVQAGASTIFEGVSDMNELQARQSQGLELEVSGYLDSSGMVQASRISLESSGFSGGTVQLKGRVSSLNSSSFSMGGLTVSTIGATFVGMNAADLAIAGLIVEVRGTLGGTTVSNARIELKKSTGSVKANDTLNIKGVAAGVPAAGSFVLTGPDGPLLVTISGSSFLRGSSVSDAGIIVPGARLEVEGAVQGDGTLAAVEIAVESEKTIRLEGDLSGVNPAVGSLLLNGVTVTTASSTTYRDNRSSPVANLDLAGLVPGDHLQVYGFQDGSGKVIASQVERFNVSSTNILQGPVTFLNAGTSQLSILGVGVGILPGATLSRSSTVYADFASFASLIQQGNTVVKAKGIYTGSVFTSSSLEIQP